MNTSVPLSGSLLDPQAYNDLMEYLNENGTKIFNEPDPREAMRKLYREFHVFLGPETRSEWWRRFTGYLPVLAEKQGKRPCEFWAYLKCAEFLAYQLSLERAVK